MARLDSPEHAALRAANPVCAECGHGHPPTVRCPDHRWMDCCPYYGLDCPSPAERAMILARMRCPD